MFDSLNNNKEVCKKFFYLHSSGGTGSATKEELTREDNRTEQEHCEY